MPAAYPNRRSPAAPPLALWLAGALALNWAAAAALPSMAFSWTSALLFAATLVLLARISALGFVVLLPYLVTRAATLASLIAIEAGAYMPEVARAGTPGDASASFVALTALWLIGAGWLIGALAPLALRHARSAALSPVIAWLGWPALGLAIGWCLLALNEGLHNGFPLIEGIDRFLYRRVDSGPFSLLLLDNKFVIAAVLGAIAFEPRRESAPLRRLAAGTFVLLIALSYLFGDKFFTILAAAVFFAMPLLLRNQSRLAASLLRAAPPLAGLTLLSLAATLYIYSGYGRLPMSRALEQAGERVAEQGELWFVASRDTHGAFAWNGNLVSRYISVLDDASPPASAFEEGVETYYFAEHYSPPRIREGMRRGGGWVQFTMGTEAMGLVLFGYAGCALMLLAGAGIVAFSALYLLRGFATGFPIGIALATWIYLQVYIAMQQASLWAVAAPGQVKRLLLCLTIELLLFAANRGATLAARRRMMPATA